MMNCYTGTGELLGQETGELQWLNAQEMEQKRFGGGDVLMRQLFQQPKQPQQSIMAQYQRRIVKVYVADPDLKLPAEQSLLYEGDEKLTELTDQELFFEVEIKDKLAKHNEARVKVVDKEQSAKFGKEIFLEPAKIRDLKMVVVNVATF